MTNSHGNNPIGPIAEEQLVDWIDGSLAPGEAEKLIARSGRGDLADRIRQMQRHRDILRSLGDERAPGEVLTGVLATLERDALVGVEHTDPSRTLRHEPMHAAMRSAKRAQFRRRLPTLAMAAGLALLVVGASYFGAMFISGKAPSPAGPALAIQQKADTTPSAREAESRKIELPDSVETPNAATESQPLGDGLNLGALAKAGTFTTPDAHAKTAFAEDAGSTVDASRAVDLAREGRLVVRVLSKDTRNLPRVEAGTGRQWSIESEVPPDVVAALLPERTVELPGPTVDQTRLIAFSAPRLDSADLLSPHVGPGAAITWCIPEPIDPIARVRGTYLVDLLGTTGDLENVKAVFQQELSAMVRYEVLPQPVQVPKPRDAEDLLWWSQPAGPWIDRVTVPVIVERTG